MTDFLEIFFNSWKEALDLLLELEVISCREEDGADYYILKETTNVINHTLLRAEMRIECKFLI